MLCKVSLAFRLNMNKNMKMLHEFFQYLSRPRRVVVKNVDLIVMTKAIEVVTYLNAVFTFVLNTEHIISRC